MATTMRPAGSGDRLRLIAVGAAAAAAALYLLIGAGVLSIGTARDGSNPGLLEFGAMAGGTFAIVAALLLRFRSRLLWAGVALLQVLVIVGYFGLSGVREPPVELWGLLVKACQLIVLVAVATLLARAGRVPGR